MNPAPVVANGQAVPPAFITGGLLPASSYSSKTQTHKVTHRKKCRHPKTATDVLHRFCYVCNAKAENYNFGVISCESCKAFFRRNAHKQVAGVLRDIACSFEHGRCEVNQSTRKRCPGCRLAKCFAVGMRVDLIQKVDCRPSSEVEAQQSNSISIAPPPMPALPVSAAPPASLPIHIDSTFNSTSHELWDVHSLPESNSPRSFNSISPDTLYSHLKKSAPPFVCLSLLNMLNELSDLLHQSILSDLRLRTDVNLVNGLNPISLLGLFVKPTITFIEGLPELHRFLTPQCLNLVVQAQFHSVVFPLSCAAFDKSHRKFVFTVNGFRIEGHPLEGICELRKNDPVLCNLGRFQNYLNYLEDITEMKPDLLALFCTLKALDLPLSESLGDSTIRSKCFKLLEIYLKHFNNALFYYFPFDYEDKIRSTLNLLRWSLDFDRALAQLFHYPPPVQHRVPMQSPSHFMPQQHPHSARFS